MLSSVSAGLGTLAAGAKRVAQRETPLEKNLREATSNENWGCPNSLLHDIARASNDFQESQTIMNAIWAGLAEKGKMWRRVIKTLTLLEFLIKNGSERIIDEMRAGQYKVRPLMDFYHQEDGKDKGAGIREKAKQIVEIVSDHDMLRQERDKAREHRNKFGGMGSSYDSGSYGGGGSSYGSGGGGSGGGFGSGSYGSDNKRSGDMPSYSGSGYDTYIPKNDSSRKKDDDDRDRRRRDEDDDRDRRRRDDDDRDRRRRDDDDRDRPSDRRRRDDDDRDRRRRDGEVSDGG